MHHKGLLGWCYNSRCNYMVTLVTDPRTSVFGELREWGVERTDEGRVVYDVWQMIEKRFPMVRATYNAIMPDHFHGIIFITTDGEVGLDDVVAFFAAEVERRIGRRVWCDLWRDSICLAKGQLHRQINYVLSNAKRRWIKENNPELFRKVMGFRHWRLDLANETLAGVPEFDERYFRGDLFGREDREFWDLDTGEEIVKPRKANRVQRAFDGGRQQAYNSKVGGRQQAYDNKESCCSTLAVSVVGKTTSVQQQGGGVALSRKGVRVTAFCPNPDGEGTVLRVWEQAGKGGEITVTLQQGMKAATAQPVNLRGEIAGEPIAVKNGSFTFALGAWAPKSFILSETKP